MFTPTHAARHSALVALLLAGVLPGIASSAALGADPALRPTIHSWDVRATINPALPVVPIPHPGHDASIDSGYYGPIYQAILNAGLAVGFMLHDNTAPYTGSKDPYALEKMLDLLPRVDLVFADFETEIADLNNYNTCAIVRSHWNPEVSTAWIGSYAQYPAAYDESQASPYYANRSFKTSWYLNIGLDVAMPDAYPYGDHQTHLNPDLWGTYLAPNIRSALFWAPLARCTVAKLSLPNNHLLIPWLSTVVQSNNLPPVPPPPVEDYLMLLVHLRLRGVDGYYSLTSFEEPAYPDAQYILDLANTWTSMDPWFEGGPVTVLNLTHDKVGGVQWSGISRPGLTAVVVSNLGNSDVTFTLPGGPWPCGAQVLVPKGTHQIHVADGTPCPEEPEANPTDIDLDGTIGPGDMGAVLAAWGPCPASGPCPADLNGDGTVGPLDLGYVLAAWPGS